MPGVHRFPHLRQTTLLSEHQQWKRYERLVDRIMAGDYKNLKTTDAYAKGIEKDLDMTAEALREAGKQDGISEIGR